jgi:Domain of unknown function (DUF1707)
MAADSRYNVESRWRGATTSPPRRPDAGRSVQLTRAARVRRGPRPGHRTAARRVADGRLDPAEFDQRLDAALAARTIDALAPLPADLIAAPGRDGSLALPLAGTPAEPAAELLTIHERHGSAMSYEPRRR